MSDGYREGYGDLHRVKDVIAILKGILDGIKADKVLSSNEISALNVWLKNNARFEKKLPFSDIFVAVQRAIEDSILEKSEIDDINFLIEKSFPILFRDNSMVYLQGLIKGFAADGILNDLELKNLRKWLIDNHERLNGIWPFDELFTLILAYKETNQISPEYINIIKTFMNDYMAIGSATELKFKLDPNFQKPVSAICASDPLIEFQDKKFCVTGKSEKYKRKEIFDKIIAAGGSPTENIWCDYLVVCSGASGLWVYQSYGRKIEAILERRKMGHQVSIILEKDLFDAFN